MKGKIVGLIISALFILLAVSVVYASQAEKYGRAKTPPFPQPAEKDLQKIVFIRYAPGREPLCNDDGICGAKENWKNCPSDCPKGGGGPTPTPEESACYGFLAGSKPRWNWTEDYYYSDLGLKNSAEQAVSIWEGPVLDDIFGQALAGAASWGVYDLTNSILYGNYPEAGVIAVTAIWYRGRNIYEYDIMFDTDYFPDSNIDLATVVLHEFGHGAGLDDLYDVSCDDNVMYGYYHGVDLDLGAGDLQGIKTLYGAN